MSLHQPIRAPTKWCPECRYPLDGLGANRRTECGHPFDPDDRTTYLSGLELGDTRVTDAALAHLRVFPRLQKLGLARTPITDAGLSHLATLKQLDTLDLTGARVTPAAVARLQQKTPTLGVKGP